MVTPPGALPPLEPAAAGAPERPDPLLLACEGLATLAEGRSGCRKMKIYSVTVWSFRVEITR